MKSRTLRRLASAAALVAVGTPFGARANQYVVLAAPADGAVLGPQTTFSWQNGTAASFPGFLVKFCKAGSACAASSPSSEHLGFDSGIVTTTSWSLPSATAKSLYGATKCASLAWSIWGCAGQPVPCGPYASEARSGMVCPSCPTGWVVDASQGTYPNRVHVTWSAVYLPGVYCVERQGAGVLACGLTGSSYDDDTAPASPTLKYRVSGDAAFTACAGAPCQFDAAACAPSGWVTGFLQPATPPTDGGTTGTGGGQSTGGQGGAGGAGGQDAGAGQDAGSSQTPLPLTPLLDYPDLLAKSENVVTRGRDLFLFFQGDGQGERPELLVEVDGSELKGALDSLPAALAGLLDTLWHAAGVLVARIPSTSLAPKSCQIQVVGARLPDQTVRPVSIPGLAGGLMTTKVDALPPARYAIFVDLGAKAKLGKFAEMGPFEAGIAASLTFLRLDIGVVGAAGEPARLEVGGALLDSAGLSLTAPSAGVVVKGAPPLGVSLQGSFVVPDADKDAMAVCLSELDRARRGDWLAAATSLVSCAPEMTHLESVSLLGESKLMAGISLNQGPSTEVVGLSGSLSSPVSLGAVRQGADFQGRAGSAAKAKLALTGVVPALFSTALEALAALRGVTPSSFGEYDVSVATWVDWQPLGFPSQTDHQTTAVLGGLSLRFAGIPLGDSLLAMDLRPSAIVERVAEGLAAGSLRFADTATISRSMQVTEVGAGAVAGLAGTVKLELDTEYDRSTGYVVALSPLKAGSAVPFPLLLTSTALSETSPLAASWQANEDSALGSAKALVSALLTRLAAPQGVFPMSRTLPQGSCAKGGAGVDLGMGMSIDVDASEVPACESLEIHWLLPGEVDDLPGFAQEVYYGFRRAGAAVSGSPLKVRYPAVSGTDMQHAVHRADGWHAQAVSDGWLTADGTDHALAFPGPHGEDRLAVVPDRASDRWVILGSKLSTPSGAAPRDLPVVLRKGAAGVALPEDAWGLRDGRIEVHGGRVLGAFAASLTRSSSEPVGIEVRSDAGVYRSQAELPAGADFPSKLLFVSSPPSTFTPEVELDYRPKLNTAVGATQLELVVSPGGAVLEDGVFRWLPGAGDTSAEALLVASTVDGSVEAQWLHLSAASSGSDGLPQREAGCGCRTPGTGPEGTLGLMRGALLALLARRQRTSRPCEAAQRE